MELAEISDHVKLPDIAILQIRHTIKSVAENKIEITLFFIILFSSFKGSQILRKLKKL